jgi:catechol 2,3-dioxygenase-like lactoylglutathione lyase family enzyme
LKEKDDNMTTVSVRYINDDVDAAVAFYVEHLGFDVEMQPGPGFAVLSLGNLRLLLNRPGAGGAGKPLPDREGGATFRTTWSRGGAAARSCSRTPRATRSSSSSPAAPEHWSIEPGL